MQKASHKIILVFCSLSFNKSNKRALFLSNLTSGFVELLIEKVFVLKKLYSSNNLPISVLLPILVIGFILPFLSFVGFIYNSFLPSFAFFLVYFSSSLLSSSSELFLSFFFFLFLLKYLPIFVVPSTISYLSLSSLLSVIFLDSEYSFSSSESIGSKSFCSIISFSSS